MFGSTKFNLTKSRKIALGVAGVALSGVIIAIATQAKAQFRISQIAPVAPVAAPDAFAAPSQIGIPGAPPARTPTTPAGTRRPSSRFALPRRIPIDPVPMPGDFRTPLPDLPRSPDIRTITGTQPTPISGISARVTLTPICPVTASSASCRIRPYTGPLKITSASRSRVIRLNSDINGFFQVRLEPGMYVIEPDSPNFPIGTSQTVTIINNVIRQMELNFQGSPEVGAPIPPPTGATLPPLR
ncbi:MAG: hypothetical protein MUC48_00850 [Leptolyngbya sp. Prado105]|jgi:hypothetical protein|nr:hypothetical protein [Leptolyngbya sp. Prado105]